MVALASNHISHRTASDAPVRVALCSRTDKADRICPRYFRFQSNRRVVQHASRLPSIASLSLPSVHGTDDTEREKERSRWGKIPFCSARGSKQVSRAKVSAWGFPRIVEGGECERWWNKGTWAFIPPHFVTALREQHLKTSTRRHETPRVSLVAYPKLHPKTNVR